MRSIIELLDAIDKYKNKEFNYFVVDGHSKIYTSLGLDKAKKEKERYNINKKNVEKEYFENLEFYIFHDNCCGLEYEDIYYHILDNCFVIQIYDKINKIKGFISFEDAFDFYYKVNENYGKWDLGGVNGFIKI